METQRHNEILMRQVAKKLKALRKAKGITQEKVYKDTGMHIGRIEAGNSNITISSLSDLCKYYEISFETFFDGLRTKE